MVSEAIVGNGVSRIYFVVIVRETRAKTGFVSARPGTPSAVRMLQFGTFYSGPVYASIPEKSSKNQERTHETIANIGPCARRRALRERGAR
jgi:hypothetical protein